MTATKAIADLYQTAIVTGYRTGDYLYAEILDSLHTAAKAIATGADPDGTARDLANEWTATANLCGSGRASGVYRTWAEFLSTETVR